MKHNILFIQADQLAAKCLGAYGSAIAKTPHLDALATRSTVFDSAYTNFPLCAPSRFSMMSGLLCSKIAAWDNGAEFPSSVPTFAAYLRSMGYQTCLSGKMHFVGADQLHGFEERITTDIYPSDFNWTGDWTEITPKFANDSRSFNKAGICTRNPQIDYDEEVCHRTCRKLYDLSRSDDDRPFLLVTSFTHPHDPYQCRQEHWDRYRHDEIDMPVTGLPPDDDLDPYTRRLIALSGLDKYQPDEATTRRARHAYYGSVSYLDDLVGKVLTVLEETGLADNTAIVFTTDHGDNLGERGLWYKKNFFEDSARIPLMVSVPGGQGNRVSHHVSLVDLTPTLIGIAGSDVDEVCVEPLDGSNLLEVMAAPDSTWRDGVYSEILAEGAAAPQIMVRRDHLKFLYSGCDPHQLYNLADDPTELVNVGDAPAYAALVKQFIHEVESGWDIEGMTREIRLSQKRRLFLREVLRTGKHASWDYVPEDQAEGQCLRSDKIYNEWAYDHILNLNTDP